MAINLTKNREKIVAAWNDVLDDKTPTDWALFGYEGQSNDLKVVATGDGGLAELQDDLNSGSIMYAFVRVLDPKTTLNKYVLINWQGEGAPTVRKGTCANHIRDVAKLLTGAHLTVNARTDDEVDPDVIIKKVSAVGSAYSFKEHRPYAEDEVKGPVGTVYSKVIPQKEINSIERDNFWRKEQEEESHRVEMERERRKLEMLKVEEENRAREEKAHNQREQQALPNKVTQSKPIEKPDVNINNLSQSMNNMESHSNPSRSMTQAEIMRQQRNQEARELIGSRVGTAKAIFTQNAASGQMKTSSKISAPAKPVRNSIAQRINTFNNSQQFQQPSIEIENPIAVLSNLSADESNIIKGTDNNKVDSTELDNALSINNPEQLSSEFNDAKLDHAYKEVKDNNLNEQVATEENQFSTIKRSPHLKSSSMESDKSDIYDRQEKEDNIDDIPNQAVKKDIVSEDDSIYQNVINDDGLKARALYDYQAADDSEITFDPGDIIIHIDRIDEGWWQGLGPDGTYGLFPANYVELI